MNDGASPQPTSRPSRFFDPLEQADFIRLEHAASLKGLLKPFKGKGELATWASQCESLRGGLIVRAQRLLSQATAYPFNQLPVELALQTTGAGTAFLRWRNTDRSAMGVSLWVDLMRHANTPPPLVHELFALELQRIALNMQISLTHSIARQALDCAHKMAQAEAVYGNRIDSSTLTTQKEIRS
ncbi:MAG: DUF3158 family protein [Steroidobacteraceae bacterium]